MAVDIINSVSPSGTWEATIMVTNGSVSVVSVTAHGEDADVATNIEEWVDVEGTVLTTPDGESWDAYVGGTDLLGRTLVAKAS